MGDTLRSVESMQERYRRPDWVRRLNVMAQACGGANRVIPLVAEHLLEHAVAVTGLDEFGTLGDGDWEDRYRRLVAAINGSHLHVVGRLLTREELLRSLETRLHLAEARRRAPEIAEERIDEPVIVTGPARSGTTILFELLGLDPGLRTPRAADVIHPAQPELEESVRLAMTECEQELWADVQPEFASMHELRADLPVECVTVCLPSFAGNHWPMILGDLGSWTPDVDADLAFHRALLQTVQHGQPQKNWLLKTPAYLMMLDDLIRTYPDARIIQTHRDPAKTMPSTVSTTAMVQWLRTDVVDLDALGPLIAALFSDALSTVADRRLNGEIAGTFGDVHFRQLMKDPVDAIERAYHQIGRPLVEAHREAIGRYVEEKPQGKFGTHRYTAEEWGFDPADLRRELNGYLTGFEVELEP